MVPIGLIGSHGSHREASYTYNVLFCGPLLRWMTLHNKSQKLMLPVAAASACMQLAVHDAVAMGITHDIASHPCTLSTQTISLMMFLVIHVPK